MKQIRNYNWDVPEDNCVCLNDILKALILAVYPTADYLLKLCLLGRVCGFGNNG